MTDAQTTLVDVLNAAAVREEAERRFREALPERDDADFDPVLLERATQETHSVAAQAEEAYDAVTSIHRELAEVRDRARRGDVTFEEAVHLLDGARRRAAEMATRLESLRTRHGSAMRTARDPSTVRAELLARYPSLRK